MNSFWRMIVEILRGIKSEFLSTFGTFITIFLAMILPGIIWIAISNLDQVQRNFRESLTVDVFLKESAAETDSTCIKEQLLKLPGVVDATYISKNDALTKMQSRFGNEIISGLDENPLPASFLVKVNDDIFRPGAANSLISSISGIAEVEDVVFAGQMLSRLNRIVKAVTLIGLGLVILVAFSAIFIVANTIRVAISNRSQTIRVMRLVGATRGYIAAPFVSLGAILGLLGSLVSISILYWAADYVSSHFMRVKFLEVQHIAIFLAAGLLLGIIGSLVAVRKHLRV